MPKSYTQSKQYPSSPKLFEKCVQAAKMAGFSIERNDPVAHILEAKNGFSLHSLGENITVRVLTNGGVEVVSELVQKTALFDYGKNKANVESFVQSLDGLMEMVGQSAEPVPVPQPTELKRDPVPQPTSEPVPKPAQLNRRILREMLISSFNLSELETLCFDLYVDYEALGANGKIEMARELIAMCERNGRIEELLHICHELRPQTDWEQATK